MNRRLWLAKSRVPRADAGVDLHSVWDLSDYGWDASNPVMAQRT